MPKTDLFGKPLGGYPQMELTLWQKRQAALIDYWMSLEYLKGLKTRIDALIQGADVNLDAAKRQGRDALIANDRWGVRDTAANWSTYAFPALEEFRQATIKDIAMRVSESYCGTGANQCARMLSETSSMWMTLEEEEAFKEKFEAVCWYAGKIDSVCGKRLDDFSMVRGWQENAALFPRLPKFRVRTDIEAVSDKMPPRTGIYVAQDDPHATLQFGWTGNNDGELSPAMTFNDVGLHALSVVGRDALWIDGHKMATFATDCFKRGELKDRNGFDPGDESNPQWAPALVGFESFTQRPCKWYFVEKVNGEFDDAADEAQPQTQAARLRCEAGQPCPREGYWFTPAGKDSRRYFKQGDVMPEFKSDYGATIWQWAEDQSDPKL